MIPVLGSNSKLTPRTPAGFLPPLYRHTFEFYKVLKCLWRPLMVHQLSPPQALWSYNLNRNPNPNKRGKGPNKRGNGPNKRGKGPNKRGKGPNKRGKGPNACGGLNRWTISVRQLFISSPFCLYIDWQCLCTYSATINSIFCQQTGIIAHTDWLYSVYRRAAPYILSRHTTVTVDICYYVPSACLVSKFNKLRACSFSDFKGSEPRINKNDGTRAQPAAWGKDYSNVILLSLALPLDSSSDTELSVCSQTERSAARGEIKSSARKRRAAQIPG